MFLVQNSHKVFLPMTGKRVNIAIHDFIQEKNWVFSQLNTKQKKTIVLHLFKMNAFQEKNAADYIARVLSMGEQQSLTIFENGECYEKDLS